MLTNDYECVGRRLSIDVRLAIEQDRHDVNAAAVAAEGQKRCTIVGGSYFGVRAASEKDLHHLEVAVELEIWEELLALSPPAGESMVESSLFALKKSAIKGTT